MADLGCGAVISRFSLLWVLGCLLVIRAVLSAAPESAVPSEKPAESAAKAKVSVVVIPVREEVARPLLYIVRRGLKEAIAQKADVVVLDIKTPGGALDTTFEILEALEKFPGQTVAFVNNEAMSAGAFISAMTEEIWFAPDGVIGAAAPVLSTGQDVDKTMKLKITSYLKARMRAISEGKVYRGQVISAMIDSETELKIGDKVLKEKGELLSLTATEASATYGDPARPLLAAGIAKNVDALLAKKFGAHGYTVKTLEVTWSERLAVLLNTLSPVLLALGIVALYVEFKTLGFGAFGVTGIVLLGLVFFGSFVAGLSGHEPILLFALGVVLLALELVFFHTAGFLGVVGVAMMLASLVWAMADLWPNEPISVAWSADAFVQPLANLGIGFALATGIVAAAWRFIPRGWFFDRLVVVSTVGGAAQEAGLGPEATTTIAALIGRRGVAVTALRPGGQVEIDGQRYEAKAEVGAIDAGTTVVVRGHTDFGLVVEKGET